MHERARITSIAFLLHTGYITVGDTPVRRHDAPIGTHVYKRHLLLLTVAATSSLLYLAGKSLCNDGV